MAINYFKGINAVGDAQLSQQLESNIISFVDWGFLTVGGYFNAGIPQSGAYGGDFARLRPDKDENYSDGRVWETARQNLVWEQDVNLQYSSSGVQPIRPSGVVVDGTFYGPADPIYGHTLQYPQGRIIFDNEIDTASTVQMSFSYKQFKIDRIDSMEFRELMFNSFRPDDETFLFSGSGQWNINPENRTQLPAVFVEVMSRRTYTGYELGGGQRVVQDVFFHIFAEDIWSRNLAVDALAHQGRSTISLFDINKMADANAYPLDYEGALASGHLNYKVLADSEGDFYYRQMYINHAETYPVASELPLFRGQVKWTVEVDVADI